MRTTKKLQSGVYIHIATKKYITSFVGEISTVWNIWNDENFCNEFAIGFNTKWQAVDYLDSIISKIKEDEKQVNKICNNK
jgi:hypothetical protein